MDRVGLMGCAVLLLAGVAAGQGTWYVDPVCGDDAWTGRSDVCVAPDGPKRTIQAAIDATYIVAAYEDTILLAPGVYSGEGNWLIDRAGLLTIRSRSGPADTILDGVGSPWPAFTMEFESPKIEGLTFQNFHDDRSGGVFFLYDSRPVIRDCVFRDNHADGDGGAIFSFEQSSPVLINCMFDGNSAGREGGAIFGYGEATAINCTFVDNWAGQGGHAAAWSVALHNCIVRGAAGQLDVSYPVTYCNVEGGHTGRGNIDADPMFVDAANGDFRLRAGSPCIDAGDNSYVPVHVTTDFDGLARFVDDPIVRDTGVGGPGGRAVVDMGAWEYQAPCVADCDGSGDLSIFDFLCYQNVFDSGNPSADLDGDGRLTIFDFLAFQNAFAAGCG